MKPWYASNARELLEMRKRGRIPDGPVAVSLIGGQYADCAAMTLHVQDDTPIDRLDWKMLVNLEVWIWADPSVPLSKLTVLADRIAQVRPRRLVLRFDHPFKFTWNDGKKDIEESIDTHDVDIGSGYHNQGIGELPATHAFLWCPIPCNGTPLEHQLRRALRATHTPGTWL